MVPPSLPELSEPSRTSGKKTKTFVLEPKILYENSNGERKERDEVRPRIKRNFKAAESGVCMYDYLQSLKGLVVSAVSTTIFAVQFLIGMRYMWINTIRTILQNLQFSWFSIVFCPLIFVNPVSQKTIRKNFEILSRNQPKV